MEIDGRKKNKGRFLKIGQQPPNLGEIGGIDFAVLAETPLARTAFLGQNMAGIRLGPDNLARARDLETFGRATIALHFGHMNLHPRHEMTERLTKGPAGGYFS
jgi:hypothetical protein